jgi:pterin-4a-carbinolamine dehydratase
MYVNKSLGFKDVELKALLRTHTYKFKNGAQQHFCYADLSQLSEAWKHQPQLYVPGITDIDRAKC